MGVLERFSYAKSTRNQREKREKLKSTKTRRKSRKGYMRSKASDTLRLNIYKALNANTLSRLSPSFRDFYLFAFFALVSCRFRVGKTLIQG